MDRLFNGYATECYKSFLRVIGPQLLHFFNASQGYALTFPKTHVFECANELLFTWVG